MNGEGPKDPAAHSSEAQARPRFLKRLLRSLPTIAILLTLTWVFGHAGVLHKIETVVSDTQIRLHKPFSDSPVVLVDIDDEDYAQLFGGNSPLNPERLGEIIANIAKGQPRVIGVDIDTSSPQFAAQFHLQRLGTHVVWEREMRELPEQGTDSAELHPLDVLGGQKNLDPATNSTGLALLIDESEDKVTRRYRRSLLTARGPMPSFPSAVAAAYRGYHADEISKLLDSREDRLIRFFGSPSSSERLHFSARKVGELAEHWPGASPIKDKIVLLGGSYAGQDMHETPVGRLSGLEVMANVVDTELTGGGEKPPSKAVVFLLELFEVFVLISLFHNLSFRFALFSSVLLIPLAAILCSLLAYRSAGHFFQFLFVLLGMLVFELYEHFRRSAVPRLYHDITRPPN